MTAQKSTTRIDASGGFFNRPLDLTPVKATPMQILVPTGLALSSIALTLGGAVVALDGSFFGAAMGAAGIGAAALAVQRIAHDPTDDWRQSIGLFLVMITGAICWLLSILMPIALCVAALSVFVSGGLDSYSDTLLPFALFVIINGGAAMLAMRGGA